MEAIMNCEPNKEQQLTNAERQPCEVYTRVMGYIRPSSEFNRGKQSEFAERKYFTEPCCCEC